VASAWLVHLYTASGALFAFFSLDLIIQDRYRAAFFWLALSAVVDATDGVLARRVGVAARLPWFDGDTLDNIVDYLTYVFVPVRYLEPSRTPVLRSLTIGLGIAWGVLMVIMLWLMPAIPPIVFWMSLIFPLYYAALSLVLDQRRRNAQTMNLDIDDR
jgi:phosphatidylserine synthase